ncbi:MAG: hypothetical protein ABIV06_12335 [Thermoanaerobaculia bacterium]
MVREHGRFLLLLTLLSFATAWMATRAVMAGVDESLTRATLTSAQQENQALRLRQETLREQTEVASTRLRSTETTLASYP